MDNDTYILIFFPKLNSKKSTKTTKKLYKSPEVMKKPPGFNGKNNGIWAICIFLMSVEHPPFASANERILKYIINGYIFDVLKSLQMNYKQVKELQILINDKRKRLMTNGNNDYLEHEVAPIACVRNLSTNFDNGNDQQQPLDKNITPKCVICLSEELRKIIKQMKQFKILINKQEIYINVQSYDYKFQQYKSRFVIKNQLILAKPIDAHDVDNECDLWLDKIVDDVSSEYYVLEFK
eukprot:253802_1